NLDENGYLGATEEELAEAYEEFAIGRPAADALHNLPAELNGKPHEGGAGSGARDVVRRAIELVQRLDPAGVCARDLRECLLIQIAAQQQELNLLYARRQQ